MTGTTCMVETLELWTCMPMRRIELHEYFVFSEWEWGRRVAFWSCQYQISDLIQDAYRGAARKRLFGGHCSWRLGVHWTSMFFGALQCRAGPEHLNDNSKASDYNAKRQATDWFRLYFWAKYMLMVARGKR